ncbi:MAG: hypothetical protein ACYSUB_22370 [Planctomycetota bacterium]
MPPISTMTEREFEDRAAEYLETTNRIILRKNGSNRNGFIGRRKPDLVTIERNLKIISWELKSPSECLDSDRLNHFWFKHPTPNKDYIASKRDVHKNNHDIGINVRGWCIVIDGELRYWIENQGKPEAWRLPFDYAHDLKIGGIIAPLEEKEFIYQALDYLGIKDLWEEFSDQNVFYIYGPVDMAEQTI